MARPKASVPKYSLHRPSGRAVVFVDRRPIYLGKHGSPESRKKYGEIIAGLTSKADLAAADQPAAKPAVSVNEILLRFATTKLDKYVTSDGDPSTERDCFLGAIRIVRKLFGETDALTFGPLNLAKAREQMIEAGWSRRYINKQIGRIRYIFRMAVSWEMIPESVLAALKTLDPLRKGDSDAPESAPRKAVPPEDIAATKRHLRERNCDLVDLLILTAARPGEILSLTTRMIDRSGKVWSADLGKHKNAHRGHLRTLHFGLRAQAILLKYLQPLKPDARLFPIKRRTFGDAVRDASVKAGVSPWTPHWLRHTAVTNIADEVDLEAAQQIAGHASKSMTIAYSRAAKKKAAAAVERLG